MVLHRHRFILVRISPSLNKHISNVNENINLNFIILSASKNVKNLYKSDLNNTNTLCKYIQYNRCNCRGQVHCGTRK